MIKRAILIDKGMCSPSNITQGCFLEPIALGPVGGCAPLGQPPSGCFACTY